MVRVPPSTPSPVLPPVSTLPAHSREWLARFQREWDRERGLSVFAYGSLMWNPGFEHVGCEPGVVRGFHRALQLRSLVNRGSAEQPGLVMTLLSGGSCRGLVYRLDPARSEQLLEQLWIREMVVGSYTPRWLTCATAQGVVKALAFTLLRRNPGWVGRMDDAALLHVLRHARGRYGSTLDYLRQSVETLRAHGIHDRELERQLALARAHGLL